MRNLYSTIYEKKSALDQYQEDLTRLAKPEDRGKQNETFR